MTAIEKLNDRNQKYIAARAEVAARFHALTLNQALEKIREYGVSNLEQAIDAAAKREARL